MLQVDHALPVARGEGRARGQPRSELLRLQPRQRWQSSRFPARTFLGWLRLQKLRDDLVGDLYRDSGKLIDRIVKEEAPGETGARIDSRLAVEHRRKASTPGGTRGAFQRGGKPTIWIERQRARITSKEGDRLALLPDLCVWERSGPHSMSPSSCLFSYRLDAQHEGALVETRPPGGRDRALARMALAARVRGLRLPVQVTLTRIAPRAPGRDNAPGRCQEPRDGSPTPSAWTTARRS